jgi:Pyridoxamine 5'-phosphate oxidase
MQERTAGLDLASEEHRLAVVEADGRRLEERRIVHSEEGLVALVRRLRVLRVSRVAIEQPNGLVVDRLLDADIAVVAVHPNQLMQGLVIARSAFEHSANYESVVVFGRFAAIEGDDERRAALAAFTNKLLPGRWDEVRQPNAKELKATMVLAMQIEQASAKVRYGGPDDDDSADASLDVWAG